jgi:hypothetical protein
MGHVDVENKTPFAFEGLFLVDEEARPLFVPIIKATYAIERGHGIRLSEKQIPVNPVGTLNGKPGESSYRYEPEIAFLKVATDVVLIGSAWTAPGSTSQVDVNLKVGPLSKGARVTGDRHWIKSLGGPTISDAEPFESIPLIFERAFGGRDKDGQFDSRNPIGRGFHSSQGSIEDGALLPNIEDPDNPILNANDKPAPTGFGFISPNWEPRSVFAGTYDSAWVADRMPLLPKDFNRRFFNAASRGLVANGYFNCDEFVLIENVSPGGPVSFSLPGIPPPKCRVQVAGGPDTGVRTNLDTVIINTDENLLVLIWRGSLAVRNGPHDIVSIQIEAEGIDVQVAE